MIKSVTFMVVTLTGRASDLTIIAPVRLLTKICKPAMKIKTDRPCKRCVPLRVLPLYHWKKEELEFTSQFRIEIIALHESKMLAIT